MVSGPFPRQYQILTTLHARERSDQRGIPLPAITETILRGSQRPLVGRGAKGGMLFEFTLGNVVVIGEVVGTNCHVITTYHES